MREVKAQTILIIIGTCLLDMGTQNSTQSLLQQVGCAVVSCGSRSLLLVNLQSHCVANIEHAADNLADMTDSAALQLDGILYFKDTAVRIADHTGIRNPVRRWSHRKESPP